MVFRRPARPQRRRPWIGSKFPSRQGVLTWAEIEVPTAPRRGRLEWAEVEVPLAPRRGVIAFAEVELPDGPRRGLVLWTEVEVPEAAQPNAGQIFWAELALMNFDPEGKAGPIKRIS